MLELHGKPLDARGATAWESPFVGRGVELDRLGSLVSGAEQLVSILGPPGMGKTRLARRVLERARATGIACAEIDASACRDLEQLRAQLILSLGGGDIPDGQADDGVTRMLASAGKLLVLVDNFETIVELGASELERWLAASAELSLLVTSRVRLRVAPETVFELGPLDRDAGAALFEGRARRAVRDFALRPDETDVVRTLVDRLDGLPLAIELAAARTRIFRPADLLRRVGARLELLASPSRGASRGTLRDAIATSFDALAEPAQRALAYLSVLVAPLTLETASSVIEASSRTEGEPSPLPATTLLEELVDASLVRAVHDEARDEVRFSMYESIREFAQLKLDALGARDHAEQVAADALLGLGEELALLATGPDAVDGLELLARAREELQRACERERKRRPDIAARLVLAIHPLALARGPIDLQYRLIGGVLQALDAASHAPLLARLHAAAGYLCFLRGEMARACEHLPVAYTLATDAGLSDVAGEARSTLMLTTQWRGQSADEAAPARDLSSFSLFTLGLRALHHGDVDGAAELLLRAHAVGITAGHLRDAARAHALYGLTRHELMKLAEAERVFLEAGAELERAGDRHFRAVVELWQGLLVLEQGDATRAIEIVGGAIESFEDVGDPYFEAAARGYRGLALLFAGRAVDARASLASTIPILRSADDTYRLGVFLPLLGAACALENDLPSAHAAFDEARLVAARAASPNIRVLGDLLEAFLDLADERRVDGEAGLASARIDARIALCRGPLRSASGTEHPSLIGCSTDVRFALALLEKSRAPRGERPAAAPPTRAALVVADDGSWFTIDGRRVDLRRRQPVARLLARLATERDRSPGTALATAELVRAGWPGEKMLPSAGANRVHVAISTLRRMGLGHRIARADGGYVIPAEVALDRASGTAGAAVPLEPG